jgi:hypothetical protein
MNKKHENQYLGTGFGETIDVSGLKNLNTNNIWKRAMGNNKLLIRRSRY